MLRITVMALVAALATVTHAHSQSGNVYPIVDSISHEANGVRAWFGYLNTNSTVTSVVVGPDNYFVPGNPNRGQPRLFQPGRHRKVFNVLFTTTDLRWHIGVNADTARAAWGPALTLDGAAPLLDVKNAAGQSRLLVTPTQMVVHAPGGAAVYSDAAGTVGARLMPGSGSWSVTSDRALKEGFAPVDGDAVLDRLADLPITTWSYTAQGAGIRHMGPTAQDFHAAFGLGDSETTISAVDGDGVALAALQALERRTAELDARLRDALQRLAALERADTVIPALSDSDATSAPAHAVAPPAPVMLATAHGRAGPGRSARVDSDTLFAVQSDDGATPLLVSASGFTARTQGGVVIRTASDIGVILPPGSGSWASTSDARSKIAFMHEDGEHVLAQVRRLPVGTWRYSGEHRVTHVGTTAQDFRAAFDLGENDVTISQVDADGVNLAGAQALAVRTAALQARLDLLLRRLAALSRR